MCPLQPGPNTGSISMQWVVEPDAAPSMQQEVPLENFRLKLLLRNSESFQLYINVKEKFRIFNVGSYWLSKFWNRSDVYLCAFVHHIWSQPMQQSSKLLKKAQSKGLLDFCIATTLDIQLLKKHSLPSNYWLEIECTIQTKRAFILAYCSGGNNIYSGRYSSVCQVMMNDMSIVFMLSQWEWKREVGTLLCLLSTIWRYHHSNDVLDHRPTQSSMWSYNLFISSYYLFRLYKIKMGWILCTWFIKMLTIEIFIHIWNGNNVNLFKL